MRNEKLVIPILMQYLYRGLRRNVILQRCYYDVTIKTFRFVNAHLTASNKGELANQNKCNRIMYT